MSQSLVQRASLTDRTVAAGREALAGRRRGLRGFLPFAGPAVIASIAYMDPGNFATNIQAGARSATCCCGSSLLANLVAMLFQALSAKLGIVTGQSLAQLCRTHFPRPLVYAMWVASEVAAMATDLAESLGAAIGLSLLFGLPLLTGLLITFASPTAAAAAGPRLPADRDADHAAFIGVIGRLLPDRVVRRPARLARLRLPRRGAAARRRRERHAGGRHHRRHRHAARDLPALQPDPGPHARRAPTPSADASSAISNREVLIALGVAGLVNMAMLAMAARVFHQGHADVAAIETAYHTLMPLLGMARRRCSWLRCWHPGLSSSVVGTMAGQTIMQDFVGFRIPLSVRRLATMVPAVIVVAMGVNSTHALVLSQVVLSLVLPVPMIALLVLSGRHDVMGAFTTSAPDARDRRGCGRRGAGAQPAAALADSRCPGVSFRFQLTTSQELPWQVRRVRGVPRCQPSLPRRGGSARRVPLSPVRSARTMSS